MVSSASDSWRRKNFILRNRLNWYELIMKEYFLKKGLTLHEEKQKGSLLAIAWIIFFTWNLKERMRDGD